jgi:hypothetical protein
MRQMLLRRCRTLRIVTGFWIAAVLGDTQPAAPAPASFSLAPVLQDPSIAQAPASFSFSPVMHETGIGEGPAAALQSATNPLLSTAVMRRGIEELAIASTAAEGSQDNAGYARTTAQELVAKQAVNVAEEPYNKITALIPEARAELLKVRKYAFLAAQHRDHAIAVNEGFRHIASDAAEAARKAVLGWIAADAKATAERSAAAVADSKGDKLAKAVAAAAEPYHLAVLRNQKFCEETYAKAKSAMASCQKLIYDAKQVALKAQPEQASGLAAYAQSTMAVASEMMNQAEDLRKWAQKLYHQANSACSNTASYNMAEMQAANNAAMTSVINPPMKLPN